MCVCCDCNKLDPCGVNVSLNLDLLNAVKWKTRKLFKKRDTNGNEKEGDRLKWK